MYHRKTHFCHEVCKKCLNISATNLGIFNYISKSLNCSNKYVDRRNILSDKCSLTRILKLLVNFLIWGCGVLYLIVSRISFKKPSLVGYLNELFQEPTKFMIIYLPSIRSWRPSHLPAAAQSYDARTTHTTSISIRFLGHIAHICF